MKCPSCNNDLISIVSRMTRENMQDILDQKLVLSTDKTMKDNWFCFNCFESFLIHE